MSFSDGVNTGTAQSIAGWILFFGIVVLFFSILLSAVYYPIAVFAIFAFLIYCFSPDIRVYLKRKKIWGG